MYRRNEKSFNKLMKSKKKSSFLKAMTMPEDQSLMYYTGKSLKGKKRKKFKKDMLGITSQKNINKYF